MFERWRVNKYALIYDKLDLDYNDPQNVVKQLIMYWRQIKVTDITKLSEHQLALTEVNMWTDNLPQWCGYFQEVNGWIEHDQEGLVLDLLGRHMLTRDRIGLDYYLADDDGVGIDLDHYFTRIKGLLCQHQLALSRHENQYYQRQCTKFYHDLCQLTHEIHRLMKERYM